MKKINLLASLAILLLVSSILATAQQQVVSYASASSSAEAAENSWTTKAPMQQARSCLGVVAVNGKIYAIGGSNESGFLPSLPSSDVSWFLSDRFVGINEEYDPETDTWTYKTSMPTPRIAFAMTVYQNKIYCIGGKTNNGLTGANEVYDPETDTWETKASMPTPRGWLKANVLNGRIYLTGGFPNSTLNEVYDPETDSWSTKTPAPTPLILGFNSAASAVFNNRIYFIGGVSQDYHYNLNQIYDAETDEWSLGASPPSSVSSGAAVATTGFLAPEQIYVLGCPSNLRQGESQTFVRVYDPENDSWTFGTDVLTKRYNFGAAILNDTVYVVGGYTYSWIPGNYSPVAVNEQYTPIGYGTIPPAVSVLSPENNRTYTETDVSLTFTVDRPVVWLGYSLDGQENVTVTGNTTIAGLTSSLHNVTVYAKDTFENTGASETIYFSITEPFPTWVIVIAITVAAIGGATFAVYRFTKTKKTHPKNPKNSV